VSTNKRLILFIIVLTLVFFIIFINKNQSTFSAPIKPPDQSRNIPNSELRVGEVLKYGIYAGIIKVGSSSFTYLGKIKFKDRLVDNIIVESSAPGFYDKESILGDISTFTPFRIERQIRLFGENISIVEDYDQNKNELVITRTAKKVEVNRIKSDLKMSNIILLLYHYRINSNLKLKKTLELNLPTKKLVAKVTKDVYIKVPYGRYPSYLVQSDPPDFKAWISKEDDGIPLRIQGAIGFGNTHLSLIDVTTSSNSQ